MRCPKCKSDKARVKYTWDLVNVVKRKRQCSFCNYSFTTAERRSSLFENNGNTWYRKQTPEKKKEYGKRRRMRAVARERSKETGIPVEQIYKEWGIE